MPAARAEIPARIVEDAVGHNDAGKDDADGGEEKGD
jgi:hypothetical protein